MRYPVDLIELIHPVKKHHYKYLQFQNIQGASTPNIQKILKAFTPNFQKIQFHVMLSVDLKADLDVDEKDSKNEDTNPHVENSTIARWTSNEIEKLMDDNSWAFGTRFHPDPMALETEFQGRQVHPLHPIFPGIIPITSTAESQKIWRPFSTGSELQNQELPTLDKIDGEIRKKRPVRKAGF